MVILMGKSQIEGFAIGLMFIPMVFPIIMVSFVMFKLSDIIVPLLELIPKAISVALTLFDPKKFINDLIFGITFGVRMMFSGLFSSADSVTSMNVDIDKENSKGKIPKVCVPPTLMNLIFLVLCPPLALFLDRGIQGLFHVIVCSILTVKLYYFPGFIYAALHILC
jgi:uncharacterized membrane protein YqaE (UPF0057 family)